MLQLHTDFAEMLSLIDVIVGFLELVKFEDLHVVSISFLEQVKS
jgi:hypothetical protein